MAKNTYGSMRTGAVFRLTAKQEAAARALYKDYMENLEEYEAEYPLDFVSYVSQMFADYHEDRPWFKANTPERFLDERGFYE
jgi:ribosomal protein S12 methylthiotransferase accessory factor YcaO